MALAQQLLDFEPRLKPQKIGLWAMAQKHFRAMAQTLIFQGFEPWEIFTSNVLLGIKQLRFILKDL